MKRLNIFFGIVCCLISACLALGAVALDGAAGDIAGSPIITVPDTDENVVSELDISWHCGYISSTDNQNVEKAGIYDNMATYSYSDMITIPRAGTKIYFTDTEASFASYRTYVFSSWKEENGEWVLDLESCNIMGTTDADSYCARVLTDSDGVRTVMYSYVSSENNEHIRLCYASGETVSKKVEYCTVYSVYTGESGTAQQIRENKKELSASLAASADETWYGCLSGRKIFFIGDSYLGGVGLDADLRWPALLAEKYDMEMTNYGINGSTVSAYDMADVSRTPMCLRWQGMPSQAPDIFVIEGGRNDFNVSAPIGDVNSTDISTYLGALNYMINGLQNKYPNTLIVCTTVWNFGSTKANSAGNSHLDYGKAMKALCEYRNIPCFDAMDINVTGVNMNSADFRAEYCMSPSDISHLNAKGMYLVMPAFEKFIGASYEKFLNYGTQTWQLQCVSERLKISGRYSVLESGVTCDFTASGIEFNVNSSGKIFMNVQSLGDNYFTVYVDGVRSGTRYHAKEGMNIIEIADTESGEHNIRIVKQTENAYARCVLRSLTCNGELLEAPADRKLYIEFIGDSISCGYGVLATGDPAGISSSLYEDGTQAYAYLTGELLGADVSVISCSGIGVTKGYVPYKMGDFYTKQSYTRNDRQEYIPERTPDVVVINLGTNDATKKADTSEFADDLRSLIGAVRSQYGGDVKIVWAYNMMSEGYSSVIRTVLDELGGESAGYYMIELPRDNSGGNNHPSAQAHVTASELLAGYILDLIG